MGGTDFASGFTFGAVAAGLLEAAIIGLFKWVLRKKRARLELVGKELEKLQLAVYPLRDLAKKYYTSPMLALGSDADFLQIEAADFAAKWTNVSRELAKLGKSPLDKYLMASFRRSITLDIDRIRTRASPNDRVTLQGIFRNSMLMVDEIYKARFTCA